MLRLFTISLPEISAEASTFIDEFRKKHDLRRRDEVAAHFTLLFGCDAIGPDVYTSHVAAIAGSSSPIELSCRYAMLGADDEDDTAYVFLVPDQGYAAISRLHDRLYTGPLRAHLRLDLPYIPHITIGALQSRVEAKALCDELNERDLRVDGFLRTLVVGSIDGGQFKELSIHPLGGA